MPVFLGMGLKRQEANVLKIFIDQAHVSGAILTPEVLLQSYACLDEPAETTDAL